MSKGPVCECDECYREWAKDEIQYLNAMNDHLRTVNAMNDHLRADLEIAYPWREYAGFLRSVIRSGETLPDDYEFLTFMQRKEQDK